MCEIVFWQIGKSWSKILAYINQIWSKILAYINQIWMIEMPDML